MRMFCGLVLLLSASASLNGMEAISKEISLSQWDSPVRIDFGDVLVGSDLAASITLINDLAEDLPKTEIRKSCGCLTELPDSIELKSGKSVTFPISLNAPTVRAVLGLKFTLVGKANGVKDRVVEFSGRCHMHFELEPKSLVLSDTAEKRFQVLLKRSKVSNLREPYTLAVRGDAIEIEQTMPNSNELTITAKSSGVPSNLTSSTCFLDVQVDGQVVESHPVDIVVSDRCVVRPISLSLDRNHELLTNSVTFLVRGLLPNGRKIEDIHACFVNGDELMEGPSIAKFSNNGSFATITIEMKPGLGKQIPFLPTTQLKFWSKTANTDWSVRIPVRVAE